MSLRELFTVGNMTHAYLVKEKLFDQYDPHHPMADKDAFLFRSLILGAVSKAIYQDENSVQKLAQRYLDIPPEHFKFFDKDGAQAGVLLIKNPQPKIIIVARGTEVDILDYDKNKDIIADINFLQDDGIHSGFLKYKNKVWEEAGMKAHIADIIDQHPDASIELTGHSLGAAMSTLLASDLRQAYPDQNITLTTFGSPRVGGETFANNLNNTIDIHRFTMLLDPVTRMPFGWYGYEHAGNPIILKDDQVILNHDHDYIWNAAIQRLKQDNLRDGLERIGSGFLKMLLPEEHPMDSYILRISQHIEDESYVNLIKNVNLEVEGKAPPHTHHGGSHDQHYHNSPLRPVESENNRPSLDQTCAIFNYCANGAHHQEPETPLSLTTEETPKPIPPAGSIPSLTG